MASTKAQIARELYRTFKHLGADKELLATVGSYGDTLDDDDVLLLLRKNTRLNRRQPFTIIEGGKK